MYKIQLKKELQ